jgi:peptidoglycan/xylan/chitin deacetylase (PgdA/CDA1 family)
VTTVVPILLYHSVSEGPSAEIAPFSLSPAAFVRHLDAIVACNATVLGVSEYVSALDECALPDRPVVITFDDGYADFYGHALPALEERGFPCTLYVATGFLEGRPSVRVSQRPRDPLLAWSQLRELVARGVEIGAHSHSHFELDTLQRRAAWREITECKVLLEEQLQTPIHTFAYPHGYSSPRLRLLVRAAGYRSACGVRNAFSTETDDRYLLARLTVRTETADARIFEWLRGTGAQIARPRELIRTRLFRAYRRGRSLVVARSWV